MESCGNVHAFQPQTCLAAPNRKGACGHLSFSEGTFCGLGAVCRFNSSRDASQYLGQYLFVNGAWVGRFCMYLDFYLFFCGFCFEIPLSHDQTGISKHCKWSALVHLWLWMINYVCLKELSENASLTRDYYFLFRAVWCLNLMVWSVVSKLLYHFASEERTDISGNTGSLCFLGKCLSLS